MCSFLCFVLSSINAVSEYLYQMKHAINIRDTLLYESLF